MASSKAKMAAGNSKRPYGLLLLLLLAIGTAMTCAVVLHKLRDRRLLGLLLQERERQLLAFQILLQRERETSQDMKRKLDDTKAKEDALKNQVLVLTDRLSETEKTVARLKEMQTELEAALEEKLTQIDKLTDRAEQLGLTNLQVANLNTLLKQKEAEVLDMQRIITKQAPVEKNASTQAEESLVEGFSGLDPKEENSEHHDGLLKTGELPKADNISRMDQEEAQVSVDKDRSNHTNGAEILASKEVEQTQDVEFDAKHTERTEAQMKTNDSNNIYSMNVSAVSSFNIGQHKRTQTESPQLEGFSNGEKKVKNSEQQHELTQEGKWVKFETIMDESTSKSENISSLNPYELNVSEGQDSSNQMQRNETLGFAEEKETVDVYFDSKHAEGTNIMKENDSNSDKADHAYVTKIEEQQKTSQVSDVAVRSESKEKGRRHRRRNRVRRKTVKSTALKRTEEGQFGKTQSNPVVQENIESRTAADDKSIGASSSSGQLILMDRIQIDEEKSSFSTDETYASVTDSSATELSRTKERMIINRHINDSMAGENSEGNNEKSEHNGSSKTDAQSFNDNGDGNIDTTEKGADTQLRTLGQSGKPENPRESETKINISDDTKGQYEKEGILKRKNPSE